MKHFLTVVKRISQALHWIGGASLIFLILLTIADVAGRKFGKPVLGTYELVGFAGAAAMALAMPYTSWKRGHTLVDVLVERSPKWFSYTLQTITRLMGMGLFALLGWQLIVIGREYRSWEQVSQTLQLPFYPVVWAVAVAMFVQALVLLCDIIRVYRGNHE